MKFWKAIYRDLFSFIFFVGLLFFIPGVFLNTHPAIREIVFSSNDQFGVIQFVAASDNQGDMYARSVQTFAEIPALTVSNFRYVGLPIFQTDIEDGIHMRGVHTINQPLSEFSIDRHIQLEQLIPSSRVVVHLINDETNVIWNAIKADNRFAEHKCVEPNLLTFMRWPLCYAHFDPNLARSQIVSSSGWSSVEPWGMWAIDVRAEAFFAADPDLDYQLSIDWFPNCFADQTQTVTVLVNGSNAGFYEWQDCENHTVQFDIDKDSLNRDRDNDLLFRKRLYRNIITFEFAYAAQPVAEDGRTPIDPRTLAAGFNEIRFIPQTIGE